MNIAIIAPPSLPVPAVKGGAIETLIETLITENEKSQNQLTVYSIKSKDAILKSRKYKNTEFVFLDRSSRIFRIRRLLCRFLRKNLNYNIYNPDIKYIIKDLEKKNIKKVVIEGNSNNELFLPLFEKKYEVYFHIHNDILNSSTLQADLIFNNCKKIITVSDFIKNRVLTIENSIEKKDKVVTLLNSINLDIFNCKSDDFIYELKSKYFINKDDIVILFSGRIVEEKGVKELIQALDYIPNHYNIKLMICGDIKLKDNANPYLTEIQSLIDKNRGKIILTGYVPNAELYKFHKISNMAVVPSIWDEPAGLVIIEAMASGLPIITTNSGGIIEYTGNDAIIVNRDQNLVKNLASAIQLLISDENLRNSLSHKSRINSRKFNTQQYYNDFIKILND